MGVEAHRQLHSNRQSYAHRQKYQKFVALEDRHFEVNDRGCVTTEVLLYRTRNDRIRADACNRIDLHGKVALRLAVSQEGAETPQKTGIVAGGEAALWECEAHE